MKVFVETARLVLREIVEDDVNGFYELDSDPEVHRYLGNKPIQSLEQCAEVIKNIRQQYLDHGIGRWAIIDKASNDFVGWTGLKYEQTPINNQKGYYDLGYRIKRNYWGKGIASETAVESLKYGFTELNLQKICGAAHVDNAASNRILKKVGLKYVENFTFHGIKCYWYELGAADWSKLAINT